MLRQWRAENKTKPASILFRALVSEASAFVSNFNNGVQGKPALMQKWGEVMTIDRQFTELAAFRPQKVDAYAEEALSLVGKHLCHFCASIFGIAEKERQAERLEAARAKAEAAKAKKRKGSKSHE